MIKGDLYAKYILAPLVKGKWAEKASPTLITGIGTLAGLMCLIYLSMGLNYRAFIALLISGFCDTLDGAVARRSLKSSDLGTVLDITSDRFVEFCVIFGLYLLTGKAAPTIVMLGSVLLCVTTFLVVGIFTPNDGEKGFHYSPGLIERFEAFIFFGMMILFPYVYTQLAYLFAALTFLTAVWRLVEFRRYQAGLKSG